MDAPGGTALPSRPSNFESSNAELRPTDGLLDTPSHGFSGRSPSRNGNSPRKSLDDGSLGLENKFSELDVAFMDPEFASEMTQVEKWFQVLTIPERTAALYTLLQRISPSEAKMLSFAFFRRSSFDSSHAGSVVANMVAASSSSLPSGNTGPTSALSPSSAVPLSAKIKNEKTTPGLGARGSTEHSNTAPPTPSYFAQDRDTPMHTRFTRVLAQSSLESPIGAAQTTPSRRSVQDISEPGSGHSVGGSSRLFPSSHLSGNGNASLQTPRSRIRDAYDRGDPMSAPAGYVRNEGSLSHRWPNELCSPPPPPPELMLPSFLPHRRAHSDAHRSLQWGRPMGGRHWLDRPPPPHPASEEPHRTYHYRPTSPCFPPEYGRMSGPPVTPLSQRTGLLAEGASGGSHSPAPFQSHSASQLKFDGDRHFSRHPSGLWANNWPPSLSSQSHEYPYSQSPATYRVNSLPSDAKNNLGQGRYDRSPRFLSAYDTEYSTSEDATTPLSSHNRDLPYLNDTPRSMRTSFSKVRRASAHAKYDSNTSMELPQDIPSWLRSLRLHKYTDNLKDVSWQELIELTDEDLQRKGISALGARRKLLKSFQHIATILENMNSEKQKSGEMKASSDSMEPVKMAELESSQKTSPPFTTLLDSKSTDSQSSAGPEEHPLKHTVEEPIATSKALDSETSDSVSPSS
ncbi:RNA hairpin binding protein [Schizosaccharomyces japonicus yFS275]|uniref:RNA-binding protein VTS1 n=1 Tax=Schizosaccharomyces japonicus (strain yFS275 / FY16936) TaxID=402676 RepID=B6K3C9_SCHJY|nr:RNA hairpin binding protein [Schizosaccharomyces japonicus yFS275]EEB07986.2 RNA hairpin binding protein [Schizosaccharomyces japonicus yFS275]